MASSYSNASVESRGADSRALGNMSHMSSVPPHWWLKRRFDPHRDRLFGKHGRGTRCGWSPISPEVPKGLELPRASHAVHCPRRALYAFCPCGLITSQSKQGDILCSPSHLQILRRSPSARILFLLRRSRRPRAPQLPYPPPLMGFQT